MEVTRQCRIRWNRPSRTGLSFFAVNLNGYNLAAIDRNIRPILPLCLGDANSAECLQGNEGEDLLAVLVRIHATK